MNIDDLELLRLLTSASVLDDHLSHCPKEECQVRSALMHQTAVCAIQVLSDSLIDVRALLQNANAVDSIRTIIADMVACASDALDFESVERAVVAIRGGRDMQRERVRALAAQHNPLRN